MGDSKVKPCTCSHAFQDKNYGVGLRLMTTGGTRDSPKYTCTVCGKENKSSKSK
jgi:hypothetical protein